MDLCGHFMFSGKGSCIFPAMEVITKPLQWSAVESLAKRDDGAIYNLHHMNWMRKFDMPYFGVFVIFTINIFMYIA